VETGFNEGIRFFSPTFLLLIGWLVQPWGQLGSVLFCMAVMLSVMLGIVFILRWKKEQVQLQQTEEIKQILNRQRHDWMNHVQVLMGYVSLNKTDRLKEYLQKLIRIASEERKIAQLRFSPLIVTLLTLGMKYQEWEWSVRLDASFSPTSEEDEKKLALILEQILQWVVSKGKERSDWIKIQVVLAQEDQAKLIRIEVFQDDQQETAWDLSSEDLKKLKREMKSWQVEVCPLENRGMLIKTAC
jgi:hypothetical protein